MSAYADTSFLASLYVLNGSSALAAARMKRAKLPLLITRLANSSSPTRSLCGFSGKSFLPLK